MKRRNHSGTDMFDLIMSSKTFSINAEPWVEPHTYERIGGQYVKKNMHCTTENWVKEAKGR